MTYPIADTAEQAVHVFPETHCVQLCHNIPSERIAGMLAEITQLYARVSDAPTEFHPRSYLLHDSIEPEKLDSAYFGQPGEATIASIENLVTEHIPGQVLQGILGGTIESRRSAVRVRRHDGGLSRMSYVPWHQDCAFLGMEEPWVTCWIPLTPCGADSPALDFIPQIAKFRFASSLEGDNGGYGMGGILDSELKQHFGSNAI